jgi:hypothetical protein
VISIALIELSASALGSSELMTIVGGFLCSIVFALAAIFMGNAGSVLMGSGSALGWGGVIVAELLALLVAASVHRVCVTTCFLFSIAIGSLLSQASRALHSSD